MHEVYRMYYSLLPQGCSGRSLQKRRILVNSAPINHDNDANIRGAAGIFSRPEKNWREHHRASTCWSNPRNPLLIPRNVAGRSHSSDGLKVSTSRSSHSESKASVPVQTSTMRKGVHTKLGCRASFTIESSTRRNNHRFPCGFPPGCGSVAKTAKKSKRFTRIFIVPIPKSSVTFLDAKGCFGIGTGSVSTTVLYIWVLKALAQSKFEPRAGILDVRSHSRTKAV